MTKNPGLPRRYRISNLFLRSFSVLVLLLAGSQFLSGVGIVLAVPVMTATKTDALFIDVNNNSQADPGDTLLYNISIQNIGSSSSNGVVFADTIDVNTTLIPGSMRTTPIARNDTYSTVGNVQLSVNAASGVLGNDNDPDGTGAVSISAFDATSANAGSVSLNADGSFTYNPAPGFSGSDTFTYTIQDIDGNLDIATVAVVVEQVVWFINNSVAGPGDGRFTSPFSSITNFNSLAADDPGDIIFVYQGAGAYSGALTLLNNQQIIGNGVGLTVTPNLNIVPASRPTIANVTLGSGNTVRGLNISASSGAAISGASVGTLIINNIAVNNTGGAGVSIANGTATATFDSISSNGGTNGVTLNSIQGSITINGGTIQNAINNGIDISSTSGTLTTFTVVNSTISNNGGTGLRANIQGTGSIGKIDINGNTFSGNPFGVALATNGTASVDFDIRNNVLNGERTQVNIAANDATHNNGVGPAMEGYIRNNNITTSPTGSVYIALWVVSDGDGNITVNVNTNTINNFGDSGIDIESRGGTGVVHATVTNNTTATTATFPLAGMFLRSGNGTVGETSLLCANLSGNDIAGGSGAVADYYLDRFNSPATLFQLQGLIPSPATPAQTETYVQSTDAGSSAYVENGVYTAAVCNTVSFAALPSSIQLAQQSDDIAASQTRAASNVRDVFSAVKNSTIHWVNGLLSTFKISTVQASGETVNVPLGDLNPGQQVIITFGVTIDDPVTPSTTTQVCNQGTISGTNFLGVLTDDPEVGGASDPTCTSLPDITPPDTSITSNPTDPSNDSSPTFEFSGTDNLTPLANLLFECDLDGSGFSACTSPFTYLAVSDGLHTFQVRAIDQAGNEDPTPASYTWTIDATPPDVTINQAVGQDDPTPDSPIHFTAVFSEPVTGFVAADVSIGGSANPTNVVASEIAPNDGTTYDIAVSGMTASGTVSASILANAAADAAGNGSKVSTSTDNIVSFILDNTPPDTSIDSGPSNPSYTSDADFTFSGTDNLSPAGSLTFECQLDGGGFSTCASPKSYSGLSLGNHTFEVRATDEAGNTDLTPASFTWEINATTSLLYTGMQVVNVGSNLKLSAVLSSPAAACVSAQTISFSLDVNPLNGSAGPYALGSAITDGSGKSAPAAVDTTGWIEGIYLIRVDFAGTLTCDASFDEATLTAASPGNAATGGGWYTLQGSGRVSFGFNVRKVDDKCRTDCAYKGNLLLMNNGKWRLKGNLDTYSKLDTGQGAASGSGDLFWWDASLNGGLGDWVLAQSGVHYTINFFDSGEKGRKNSTDAFGINIQYSPSSPQPNNLPNSEPIQLKGGDIKVQ